MTVNRRTSKNIAFSDIFQRKKQLFVLFSDDMAANYRIAESILNWREERQEENQETGGRFESLYFLFPEFQKNFFTALLRSYSISVNSLSFSATAVNSAVVVNLNRNGKILRKWSHQNRNVTMGSGKYVNVKFLPAPVDPEKIIIKVSELLRLPSPKPALNIDKTDYSPKKIKDKAPTYKTVVAVNNFLKRKATLRKIAKNNTADIKTITTVSATEKKWPFTVNLPLDLKGIVDECCGAKAIITDDAKLRFVLEKLGFKVLDRYTE